MAFGEEGLGDFFGMLNLPGELVRDPRGTVQGLIWGALYMPFEALGNLAAGAVCGDAKRLGRGVYRGWQFYHGAVKTGQHLLDRYLETPRRRGAPGGEDPPDPRNPCGVNSFSAETLVTTADGLRPISTIQVGDLVLAYDEATQTTGMVSVTAVIAHTDPAILRLIIGGAVLKATAEHPFFTQERGWVDAGDLWQGAHVRRADGTYDVVWSVAVETEPQVMYNLTVAQAHTFFVGVERWLVHNASCKVNYQKIGGFTRDVLTKGFHVNSDIGEISLTPNGVIGGAIEIKVEVAGSKTGKITNTVVDGVRQLLKDDPQGGIDRADAIISQFKYDPKYAHRVAQAELIKEALTKGNYTVVK
jgi:hypothetical protein